MSPDLPRAQDVEPWRCRKLAPFCADGSRWWLSVHGVVNCLNCTPPAFPELVRATGTADDAPLVLKSRTSTPAIEPAPAELRRRAFHREIPQAVSRGGEAAGGFHREIGGGAFHGEITRAGVAASAGS